MISDKLLLATIVLLLTFISGWGDSRGFIHASKIWDNGSLVTSELFRSAVGFAIGIASYWIAIRYLNQIKLISPEIQTIGWFAVTMIGVAVSSGEFSSWNLINKTISVFVLFGLGWLLIRV